ncbi:uncharacterized protein LOC131432955 [Malaya genurostris]|uniref:uncharacterized protein LOC131432955 n=1 Tax=Malaya genurostris TaxID=325434 RepID=UPI0026F3E39E|nr:uncharacterized protein LOC131432955 [Malaya genurostris]
MEERIAGKLKAKGKAEPLIVSWTGDIKRHENGSRIINLQITANGSSEPLPLKNVRTVSKLMLPKQNVKFADVTARYPHLAGLSVADHSSEEPAILIGLDNLHLFAPLESRVGKAGEPIAVRSELGWTVYGPEKQKPYAETFLNLHVAKPASNQELHDMMREQYVLDEVGVTSFGVPESVEDQRARAILRTTTARVGDRFQTGLLWREDERRFPDSYPMAVRRMKALERKLEKDSGLKENVCRQIDEYQAKGYAHKATTQELAEIPSTVAWYLPLNVVLNPRKPDKVRLVWDAAASVNGVSLNTELLKGPDMLVSLPGVISRFRERPVAFGGDIAEMYHQIRVRPEDKSAQRFLFRKDPEENPQVYMMDVLTFGSTCSPCSAQYVKNLNAEQYSAEFPEAAEAILHRHYVDDYYDSTDTVEDAIRRAKEVQYIHDHGGFHIRNWVSNSKAFLDELGERKTSASVHFNRDKTTEYERVLGIVWEPEQDVFSFATSSNTGLQEAVQSGERPTKRKVLSCVMALFDPLGLLSPFTVLGRMLVQDIWRHGCDWDECIDNVSHQKWTRWSGLLSDIERFKIPRSYFGSAKSGEIEDVQLHIFTDASETAYGCVAYFRAVIGGEVRCALVMSRSKVAPLKQLSIPRLELQGAVLGARLAQTVQQNHSLRISKQFFWTDSQTVLSWIRSDQRRYKQFVGFRIGEIMSLTKLTEWCWVPTKLNVADQLTKWGKDLELLSDSSWVRGPNFLYEKEEDWPRKSMPPANTAEELRVHLLLHDVAVAESLLDFRRFSKWTVLVRTMATVYRFISNCRRKAKGLPTETLRSTEGQKPTTTKKAIRSIRVPLRQEEYQKAERSVLKMAQVEAYIDELKVLLKNRDRPTSQWQTVEKSSALHRLTPLVEEDGLIRMEGRSANAEFLPFDLRFPVIVPDEHPVAKLLVEHYHKRFGHGYRDTVKNELRQRFHIPKINAVVRKVTSCCVWCRVHRSRPQAPRMAPLPVQRLTPYLRAFSYVGVDYLGPFEVTVGRRKEKRWVVLFTCLVIRAVHVEVAHSLTTQSCLMAIRRFICRRGTPIEFFSDNGTNLRGASKEIVGICYTIGLDCADEFTNAQTKWTFNPPAAPHMGGVWERLVRSIKEALQALNNGRRLTDEILQTSIVEAEEMVNSRPLTYVSEQSSEAEVLTPNKFLRNFSPIDRDALPSPVKAAEALRDSFKRSQELAEEMWKRWITEYIPTVNQRTKWFKESRPLKAGDLVYVVEGTSRKSWVRGIVEQPIVAGDGRIRQALVRTKNGVFKRAAVNLAVLELDDGNTGLETGSQPGLRAGEMFGTTPSATLPAADAVDVVDV